MQRRRALYKSATTWRCGIRDDDSRHCGCSDVYDDTVSNCVLACTPERRTCATPTNPSAGKLHDIIHQHPRRHSHLRTSYRHHRQLWRDHAQTHPYHPYRPHHSHSHYRRSRTNSRNPPRSTTLHPDLQSIYPLRTTAFHPGLRSMYPHKQHQQQLDYGPSARSSQSQSELQRKRRSARCFIPLVVAGAVVLILVPYALRVAWFDFGCILSLNYSLCFVGNFA